MKERRNLSGCYFRFFNKDSKRFDNVCFEDLNEEEQDKQMEGRSDEWLRNMVKLLSGTVNRLGDQFDILSD